MGGSLAPNGAAAVCTAHPPGTNATTPRYTLKVRGTKRGTALRWETDLFSEDKVRLREEALHHLHPHRGTSPIRNSTPPSDHRRALDIVLPECPTRWPFLISEVPLCRAFVSQPYLFRGVTENNLS